MTDGVFNDLVEAIAAYELKNNKNLLNLQTVVQHMNNSYPKLVWNIATCFSCGNKTTYELMASDNSNQSSHRFHSINGEVQDD